MKITEYTKQNEQNIFTILRVNKENKYDYKRVIVKYIKQEDYPKLKDKKYLNSITFTAVFETEIEDTFIAESIRF
jgi:hypothetical protein